MIVIMGIITDGVHASGLGIHLVNWFFDGRTGRLFKIGVP